MTSNLIYLSSHEDMTLKEGITVDYEGLCLLQSPVICGVFKLKIGAMEYVEKR